MPEKEKEHSHILLDEGIVLETVRQLEHEDMLELSLTMTKDDFMDEVFRRLLLRFNLLQEGEAIEPEAGADVDTKIIQLRRELYDELERFGQLLLKEYYKMTGQETRDVN